MTWPPLRKDEYVVGVHYKYSPKIQLEGCVGIVISEEDDVEQYESDAERIVKVKWLFPGACSPKRLEWLEDQVYRARLRPLKHKEDGGEASDEEFYQLITLYSLAN